MRRGSVGQNGAVHLFLLLDAAISSETGHRRQPGKSARIALRRVSARTLRSPIVTAGTNLITWDLLTDDSNVPTTRVEAVNRYR